MNSENSVDPQKVINKFRIVKHGLDKDEVYTFIARLIDKNAEYAEKLQHVDSLKRLAEITLIEANKMAEQMKSETILKAAEDAVAIMADAEKKAILEALRIISESERRHKEKIEAAEELDKSIIERATIDAEKIKAKACDEANRISTEATVKAEEFERTAKALAEIEARGIVAKALQDADATRKNADHEALIIKRKAEDFLSRSRHSISEMKKHFEEIFFLLGEAEQTEQDEGVDK